MEIPTGLGDVLSGSAGLLGTIYNLYTNQRDFDYQKALQQTMFEREDTAVQRRMADLQAAGINPNLAAGSAASAGSVVSRSNTNDVNIGAALDTMMAFNQIKSQKQQIQNAKKEYEYLSYQTAKYQQDWAYDRLMQLKLLGFNPKVSFGKDGKIHTEAQIKTNSLNDTPLGNMLDYEYNNQKNSADMLQKQVDWYTANQIINAVSSVGGLGIGTYNAFTNGQKTAAQIRRYTGGR